MKNKIEVVSEKAGEFYSDYIASCIEKDEIAELIASTDVQMEKLHAELDPTMHRDDIFSLREQELTEKRHRLSSFSLDLIIEYHQVGKRQNDTVANSLQHWHDNQSEYYNAALIQASSEGVYIKTQDPSALETARWQNENIINVGSTTAYTE